MASFFWLRGRSESLECALGKANAKMSYCTKTTFQDRVSYDLRRAQEERRKAAETLSERDRALRIEIAEIFEARAEAALTPAPAQGELVPTMH